MVGTPPVDAPAEQALRRLTWLAVVVFVIVELLLVLAIVLDAVIANHGVLAPVLEGALSTLVAAIVVYFAYFYARASMVRLSDAESARTRAEARVKELSENEHALLNATPASALLMDADEKILAINETGASMLGSSPEDLVGKSVGDFLPAAISTDRIRLLEDVKGNSEGLDFTAAYAGKDYRHIVVPIFDEEGSVVRMAVYALDVTDQEEAESKVRESEERYRTLFRDLVRRDRLPGTAGPHHRLQPVIRQEHRRARRPQQLLGLQGRVALQGEEGDTGYRQLGVARPRQPGRLGLQRLL